MDGVCQALWGMSFVDALESAGMVCIGIYRAVADTLQASGYALNDPAVARYLHEREHVSPDWVQQRLSAPEHARIVLDAGMVVHAYESDDAPALALALTDGAALA